MGPDPTAGPRRNCCNIRALTHGFVTTRLCSFGYGHTSSESVGSITIFVDFGAPVRRSFHQTLRHSARNKQTATRRKSCVVEQIMSLT